LFALGCSGDANIVPLLLEQLTTKDPVDAKLAAQAYAAIVGIDFKDDSFAVQGKLAPSSSNLPPVEQDDEAQAALPPLAADDLDADLVPAPEDALPEPNAEAIVKHWKEAQSGFDTSQRYLGGATFSLTRALDYLKQAPSRLRHPVALELGVRSGAKLHLNTRLFTMIQHAQLDAARGLIQTPLRVYCQW
jgi:hypothetical protein